MKNSLIFALLVATLGLSACSEEQPAAEGEGIGTESTSSGTSGLETPAGPGGTPRIPDATSESKVVPPGTVIPPGEIAPLSIDEEANQEGGAGNRAGNNAGNAGGSAESSEDAPQR